MIPLFRPSCTDLEVKYVTEVLRSGYWGAGPRTEELEQRFAEFAGATHAVAMSSCTAALQLTCQALGVAGGEVILPALTFAATATAVLNAGARVRFADVNEQTLCLDWKDAGSQVGSDTRAVIPVWYGGTVAPLPETGPFRELGVPIIEDCAHAAGNPQAGRAGVAACWSFHAVKNLAAGDGGMVTTDDDELAARLRRLRWFGVDKSTWDRDKGQRYSWEYDITEAGWKASMNDLTAALALAQLERLSEMNEARRAIVTRYLLDLWDLDWLRLPDLGSAHHLFVVRIDPDLRDAFIAHMLAQGVTAGVHYKPLNTYPVFGDTTELPVTDRVWRELVTLPLYPDMTSADVSQVVAAARSFR